MSGNHWRTPKAYASVVSTSLNRKPSEENMSKLLLACAFAAAMANVGTASAQVYPSRPVTMIVSYAAGGSSDVLGRILAEGMRARIGQPVIVENVSGASGSIGVGRVARAAPDGYTISIGNWSTHVVNAAIYPLQYDVLKDFEPVALLSSNPVVIVTKNSIPANDLKGLIAWLKANPDKASAGTAGGGSPQHVSGVLLQSVTGTRFQFVPYRSGSLAMQDLLSGQLELLMDNPLYSLPQVRAGRIKAYAVMSKGRMAGAPDIPTVDEAGLPGLYNSTWFAVWAPKGTPRQVVGKLNAAIVDTLADPGVRSRFTELGQEIFPPEQQTPEALGAHQKAEIEKWWPIVKAAGIKGE
jgi:tripartite-type tricarboxylate transporter receptor subunit TctC